ncbi:hypothetical protein LTR41_010673 [Exophiala xenobiotica]|nr:hypothetical protein LTR41_010673 [Exophiala xenobiotica]
MTTAAPVNIETTLNPSNKNKPPQKGKGRAVLGAGNGFTPEPSLEPDHARNEADLIRKQAEGFISSIEEVSEKPQEIEHVDNPTPSIEIPEDAHEASTTRSQPPEDEEDHDDHGKQKKTTNIQDMLNYKSDDYHGILGIGDNYDTPMLELSAIETAVWDRGTDLHPKYNQSEGAGQAFKMVCDAGRALGCSESLLEDVNNWEGMGESDDEDGGGMDGLEREVPWPTEFVENIYQEATEYINYLQAFPRLASIHKKIKTFNDRIRAQNREDGKDLNQWVIDYKSLADYYTEADSVIPEYEKDKTNQELIDKAMAFRSRVDAFLTKNHYPNWEVTNANRQLRNRPKMSKETPSASASSSAQAPQPPVSATSTVQVPKPQGSVPSPQITTPTTVSTTGTGQSIGATILKKKSSIAPQSKASPSVKTGTWRPGMTERGERILAMAPTESKDATGKPRIMRCRFVVEKKGEKNGIAFEDTVEIGERATKGYLEDLPEADRVDIRCKAKKYTINDRKGFRRIVGVTAVESENPRIFPPIAVGAEYDDGRVDVMNRTGWRDIWKSKADIMIEHFFESNELDIPWAKRAKRPGCSQYSEPHNDSGQFRSFRHLDRGGDSEAPIKRRSSSVRSTASYLSEAGLERLEAVEMKLKNLSGMEERLMGFQQACMESVTAKFTATLEGLMAQMSQMRAV